MKKTNEKLSPDDIEALLPWHAAGTLNSRDSDEVEKALADNPELARRLALAREEMTETILLNESLGAPSARVMQSLFKAIDKERKSVRVPAASRGIVAWFVDLFTPRVLAFSASAAAVIILLQAGVIAKMVLNEQGGGTTFETASAPSTVAPGAYALVRFAPQAAMSDISQFLGSHGAAIVDGPKPSGANGMYRVRIADMPLARDELDRAVKQFRSASNLVTFAAPTE
jgi:anti-sigma factor RsiW